MAVLKHADWCGGAALFLSKMCSTGSNRGSAGEESRGLEGTVLPTCAAQNLPLTWENLWIGPPLFLALCI